MYQMKKTVYLALPLTHIKTDIEKDEIRRLISWFKETIAHSKLLCC